MFLPHFDVFCDLLLSRRTATRNLLVFYNNEKLFLLVKYFLIMRMPLPRLCFGEHEKDEKKEPFDVIYYLYKMKQFHWLLCVAKNFDWSKKIKPLSNLTVPRGMKTYSESRIKLRNLKNLEENAGKMKSIFVIRAARELKSLDMALQIAGVEKLPSENLWFGQPRGHLIQVLNERSINDGEEFCLLWLVILKSV